MKTMLMMRVELFVGLLGLVYWLTDAQEIQLDEISTTEWITTDVPTAPLSVLDVTTSRPDGPVDEDSIMRPQIDSRARILINSEFVDDSALLIASQTSIPSIGSTVDNSLRSSNNNDWTPIVWPSTKLVSVTPLPSPITSPIPARGPSTLVIRPTPLLRPLPTITAAPAKGSNLNIHQTVSSSVRTLTTVVATPTPTPTAPSPTLSSQLPVVHFDLQDASSGPKFPTSIDKESSSTIPQPVPTVNVSTFANESLWLQAEYSTLSNDSSLVSVSEAAGEIINTTAQPEPEELVIVSIKEFFNASIQTPTIRLNETSLATSVSTTNSIEEQFVTDDSIVNGVTFGSSSTQPSNDTILTTEGSQLYDDFTTQLEDSSMTTHFSTTSNANNESKLFEYLSNQSDSSGLDISTFTDWPTESSFANPNATNISSNTSTPATTVTLQLDDSKSTSIDEEESVSSGQASREESARFSTLSSLSGIETLFPALTRPPTTVKLPSKQETNQLITTTPTPLSIAISTPTAGSTLSPTTWSLTPHQEPPKDLVHLFVDPLASWPTTTPSPLTTFHKSFMSEKYPSSTGYYPSEEWPSTEGSQSDGQDSNTTVVAVSVSIAIFLCIAIALLLFLVLRRRRARAVQGTCQPARMDVYSLDNVSQSNTWQRGKVRNSLRASKRSYLNQAFDDSTAFSVPLTSTQLALYMEKPITSIEAEFRNIATSTVRIDELPMGVETKNRYANVLPVPETRVYIRVQDNLPNDTLEQYINANYVKGPKEEPKYYIASQAPTEETVQDFWQMIWENQCKTIIQLTDLSENGVSRCAEYLPPSEVLDCHRLYSDYQVTLKSRELRDNYVTSHLQLKRMEDNLLREITHLWYSSWPTAGVPEDGKTIVALLLEARKDQSKEQKAPMVIHCSPGTGRTGAVLAIDVCMRHLDSSRSINVPLCVHRLRQDRAGCVQTGEQYAFIYKAVNHYSSQLNNAALDSL